jgi:repressor LexA
MTDLTRRQRDMVEFIGRFRQGHAYGPTRKEIVVAVGLSSTSVCEYNLRALRRRGMVTWVDEQARTLEVIPQVQAHPVCPQCGNNERFNVFVPALVGYEWELFVGWRRDGDDTDPPSESIIEGSPYRVTCAGCGEAFECLPWRE